MLAVVSCWSQAFLPRTKRQAPDAKVNLHLNEKDTKHLSYIKLLRVCDVYL